MVSTWRNFKNIFPRPLFFIIFRPEMLKFHPYSILTGETRVEFVIYCVLSEFQTILFKGKMFESFPLILLTILLHEGCWNGEWCRQFFWHLILIPCNLQLCSGWQKYYSDFTCAVLSSALKKDQDENQIE